jgi:hypothetical protein
MSSPFYSLTTSESADLFFPPPPHHHHHSYFDAACYAVQKMHGIPVFDKVPVATSDFAQLWTRMQEYLVNRAASHSCPAIYSKNPHYADRVLRFLHGHTQRAAYPFARVRALEELVDGLSMRGLQRPLTPDEMCSLFEERIADPQTPPLCAYHERMVQSEGRLWRCTLARARMFMDVVTSFGRQANK